MFSLNTIASNIFLIIYFIYYIGSNNDVTIPPKPLDSMSSVRYESRTCPSIGVHLIATVWLRCIIGNFFLIRGERERMQIVCWFMLWLVNCVLPTESVLKMCVVFACRCGKVNKMLDVSHRFKCWIVHYIWGWLESNFPLGYRLMNINLTCHRDCVLDVMCDQ